MPKYASFLLPFTLLFAYLPICALVYSLPFLGEGAFMYVDVCVQLALVTVYVSCYLFMKSVRLNRDKASPYVGEVLCSLLCLLLCACFALLHLVPRGGIAKTPTSSYSLFGSACYKVYRCDSSPR